MDLAGRPVSLVHDMADQVQRATISPIQWFEWAASYFRAADSQADVSSYRIDPSERTLYWDSDIVWKADDPRDLLPPADWYVFRDWANRLSNQFLVCHAATLERDGAALLLVGYPGAGKSSLALELVRRGCGFLGDEYAVISPRTLEALPFPKALCVKRPESAAVSSTDPHFEAIAYPPGCDARYDGAVCCLPRQEIVPPAGQRFPVQWLVFLRDEAASQSSTIPPRWRATLALFKSSWRGGDRTFRAAAAVVRSADCYEMTRHDLGRMADRIESFANSTESPKTTSLQ